MTAWLHSGASWCDPRQEVIESGLPPIKVYAGRRGHRIINGPHTEMIKRWSPHLWERHTTKSLPTLPSRRDCSRVPLWTSDHRTGGPLDAVLDAVRAQLPGLIIHRLNVPHPVDDDSVYLLGDVEEYNRVQVDTRDGGQPPFLIEGTHGSRPPRPPWPSPRSSPGSAPRVASHRSRSTAAVLDHQLTVRYPHPVLDPGSATRARAEVVSERKEA